MLKTIEIKPGVQLHFSPDKKFKTTIICVLFRRPLCREEVTLNALLPGVLKSGSNKYGTLKEINGYMDRLYGGIFDVQIIKKGEEQLLQFYIEVLNSAFDEGLLEKALEFLAEIIYQPKVWEKGFYRDITEREKENLRLFIESRINSKSEYLKLKCLETMCGGDAFGIYGDGYSEDIDNITEETLYQHYRKVISTSPLEIVVMGDEEKNRVLTGIKRIFEPYLPKEMMEIKPSRPYEKKKDRDMPLEKEEKLGLSQAKICMGFGSGIGATGKEFFGYLLFSQILGGGANSRLFANVREKESLCYNISSFIYRFKGILMIECGVDIKQMDKTLDLIREEIGQLKDGDFSDEETESARESLIKVFQGFQDHPAAIMDFYLSQYLLQDQSGLDEFINGIAKAEKKDIVEAAGKLYEDTVYILQ